MNMDMDQRADGQAPVRIDPSQATPWGPHPLAGAPRGPLKAVLGAISMLFGSILLCLGVAFGVAWFNGTSLMDGDPKSTAMGWVFTIASVVQQLTLVGLVWIVAGTRGRDRTQVLLLAPPKQGWRAYVASFAALIALVGVMSLLIYWIDPKAISADLVAFREMVRQPSWWLLVLMVSIGAPLAEELLFRGYLFSALAPSHVGVVGASIITTLGWAALHGYSPWGLFQVCVMGLFFSAVLVRTGSLRVPIVCHGLHNLVQVALLLAEVG
jgi:uncharacterized protein